jgi:hypothetical protein
MESFLLRSTTVMNTSQLWAHTQTALRHSSMYKKLEVSICFAQQEKAKACWPEISESCLCRLDIREPALRIVLSNRAL